MIRLVFVYFFLICEEESRGDVKIRVMIRCKSRLSVMIKSKKTCIFDKILWAKKTCILRRRE